MFFSGCGHCKKAKPEFTEAAEQFKDDNKVGLMNMRRCLLPNKSERRNYVS